jgi:aryl-alcohol dehydrogenase-like predicted oxidoreductase
MISKLILGTAQFGQNYGINNKSGQPSKYDTFEILDCANQKGINIIDTADAYGNASDIIGEYNQINPNAFKINTKFKIGDIEINNQLDIALNKLCVDKINTYFYHSFTDFIGFPESLDELVELREKKLIEKIGISVYDNDEFLEGINCKEINTIQIPFNLFDNYYQRGKLLELAKSKGKNIQVRSVYLQGLFFMNPSELPLNLQPLSKYIVQINKIASENKISINNLALQYAIMQSCIDNVIVGVDNISQLEENIQLLNQTIDINIKNEIDNIHILESELLYPKNW